MPNHSDSAELVATKYYAAVIFELAKISKNKVPILSKE